MAIRKWRYLLIPVLMLAWFLHGVSEWLYSAAAWLYERCGTTIFEANIKWEE